MKIKEFGPGTHIPAPFGSATAIVIVCKRSLGQGNVFTPVCHSVHGGGVSVSACITGHMTGDSLSSGGSLSRGVSVPGGGPLSNGGLCPGALCPRGVSVGETPHTVMSGRYISYWNAFWFHTEIERLNFTAIKLNDLK